MENIKQLQTTIDNSYAIELKRQRIVGLDLMTNILINVTFDHKITSTEPTMLVNYHPDLSGLVTAYTAYYHNQELLSLNYYILPNDKDLLLANMSFFELIYCPNKAPNDSVIELLLGLKISQSINMYNVSFEHNGYLELLNTMLSPTVVDVKGTNNADFHLYIEPIMQLKNIKKKNLAQSAADPTHPGQVVTCNNLLSQSRSANELRLKTKVIALNKPNYILNPEFYSVENIKIEDNIPTLKIPTNVFKDGKFIHQEIRPSYKSTILGPYRQQLAAVLKMFENQASSLSMELFFERGIGLKITVSDQMHPIIAKLTKKIKELKITYDSNMSNFEKTTDIVYLDLRAYRSLGSISLS